VGKVRSGQVLGSMVRIDSLMRANLRREGRQGGLTAASRWEQTFRHQQPRE